MNKLLIFTFIFMIGCATSPKDKTKNPSNIKAEDFKKTKSIKYRKNNIKYHVMITAMTNTILTK